MRDEARFSNPENRRFSSKKVLHFSEISAIINKYAGVAEWQTHRTQNATVYPCRFKSGHRHQITTQLLNQSWVVFYFSEPYNHNGLHMQKKDVEYDVQCTAVCTSFRAILWLSLTLPEMLW